ncbi:MAG TPA: hypothetical protein VKS79_21370, partial [Gemmataceae bacterium]|nr:hypothetical protein [Gemmataceae bacterium]
PFGCFLPAFDFNVDLGHPDLGSKQSHRHVNTPQRPERSGRQTRVAGTSVKQIGKRCIMQKCRGIVYRVWLTAAARYSERTESIKVRAMANVTCQHCRTRQEIAGDAAFCPNCGKPFSAVEAPRSRVGYALAPEPAADQAGGSSLKGSAPQVAPSRRKNRRAVHTQPEKDRLFLPPLAGVLGAWSFLVLISMFMRIGLAAAMLTLGFPLIVLLGSWFWLATVGTQDGMSLQYFLPRIRRWKMEAIKEYVRQNPRRAGTPFWMSMLAACLFFVGFAVLLIRQKLGSR